MITIDITDLVAGTRNRYVNLAQAIIELEILPIIVEENGLRHQFNDAESFLGFLQERNLIVNE